MSMKRSESQYEGGNKHVFVINVAVAVLELVRERLQDEHYNVTTATVWLA
jgi:hypothetical protein